MYEILLVDDHTHLVDSMAITIPWEAMGIAAVHKAYSGEEALELLAYHAIDIVVTDIQMNGMSGLELISRINEKQRNVRTIILTGHDEFQYAKEALHNRVSEYLLKPVPNEELAQTVRRLLAEIEQEGKALVDQQKITDLFRESLPRLRESLLLDLLAEQRIAPSALKEKIDLYRLGFRLDQPATLLCIRIEEDYSNMDLYSVSLLEYAFCNIAEEVFSGHYRIWTCKDPYDYFIMMVQPLEGEEGTGTEAVGPGGIEGGAAGDSGTSSVTSAGTRAFLEDLARHVQHQVKLYLKMKVSIVVSPPGKLLPDLAGMYHAALSTYSDFIGYQTESYLNVMGDQTKIALRPLSSLYATPTLMQLIDVEQWGSFEEKLTAIFDELDHHADNTNEYGFEIYTALLQAFTYYVHKKGKRFFEVFGRDIDMMLKAEASWSSGPLREWAMASFHQLKAYSSNRSNHLRSELMERVYRFMTEHLSEATLQSVADHVELHPVYVSNLFKQESGENFSAYVLRLRMDKAVELLGDKERKVSQIALEVGYQKPQYFIKLFKNQFGMTPQDFRNKNAEESRI
ncbi:response regulator [Paenibacillus sp. HB172176]|uniref:response regulator transcription factor n=1 Tax=Paenibacillus sp. HB172176 TaxID=2493690 RepID=UPI00143A2AF9|nr:response regulator [Paenibacillus sp. HB172176]